MTEKKENKSKNEQFEIINTKAIIDYEGEKICVHAEVGLKKLYPQTIADIPERMIKDIAIRALYKSRVIKQREQHDFKTDTFKTPIIYLNFTINNKITINHNVNTLTGDLDSKGEVELNKTTRGEVVTNYNIRSGEFSIESGKITINKIGDIEVRNEEGILSLKINVKDVIYFNLLLVANRTRAGGKVLYLEAGTKISKGKTLKELMGEIFTLTEPLRTSAASCMYCEREIWYPTSVARGCGSWCYEHHGMNRHRRGRR